MFPLRIPLRFLTISVLISAGCARQDTEILTRVGKQLGDKAQSATAGLRERLPFRIVSAGEPAAAQPEVKLPDVKQVERTLVERVQLRLQGDKSLASTAIEITSNGAEVQLKGTLDNENQKRRAVDLAESTVGVEKLIDSLQIRGEAKSAE